MRAHPSELMEPYHACGDDPFLDNHVAAEPRVIGYDSMVAYPAIVCDVHVIHQQDVAANPGYLAASFGTPMDCHELADNGVIADLHARRLATVFEILRRGANRGELEDAAAGADRSIAFDNGVSANRRSGTDYYSRPDYRSWTNFGR
jgi:hypothetical protein